MKDQKAKPKRLKYNFVLNIFLFSSTEYNMQNSRGLIATYCFKSYHTILIFFLYACPKQRCLKGRPMYDTIQCDNSKHCQISKHTINRPVILNYLPLFYQNKYSIIKFS